MNETIQIQLDHRSIRDFKNEPVSTDDLKALLDVMNRTASSRGLQSCSVIRLTSTEKKAAIAEIAGQAYIATAPEVWIFVADCYRNQCILKEKGQATPSHPTIDRLLEAFSDSYLASQAVMTAIEALGMGGVFLGSIAKDLDRLSELLALPPFTYPVLGIAFGAIADPSQLKPRMPLELKVGENTYPQPTNYLKALAAYDEEMTHYYDTRQKNRRSASFTDQVVASLTPSTDSATNKLTFLKQQGFDLNE